MTQGLLRIPVQAGNPLFDVHGVRSVLGLHEDEVLAAVYDGRLGWAWDIQTHESTRMYPRILPSSVAAFQAGDFSHGLRVLDEVIPEVIPHGRETLTAVEWAWRFNCGADHVANLIREGSLEVRPGPRRANESPRILRDSILRFLRTRRIT